MKIRPQDTKTCPRCGTTKAVDAFYRDKSKSNGRRFICIPCDLAKARHWYADNPEYKLAQAKARYARQRALAGEAR
jgi:hypothetical protein